MLKSLGDKCITYVMQLSNVNRSETVSLLGLQIIKLQGYLNWFRF